MSVATSGVLLALVIVASFLNMSARSSQMSAALPTILHSYAPRLVAVEHLPIDTRDPPKAHNFIFFLGGLGDGLRTVDYPLCLARSLSKNDSSWTVIELLLSSSYNGWTTSSLDSDAKEVDSAVSYFRSISQSRSQQGNGKIILLGHSTGCQISINYAVGPHAVSPIPQSTLDRSAIDGLVLQAGISDRESIGPELGNLSASLDLARDWVRQGRGGDQLARWTTQGMFGANPSARRWLSLASPRDDEGDDDYFSSDLSDARVDRIWGKGGLGSRGIPVLTLFGEKDQFVPAFVDKEGLLEKWSRSVKGAGGKWSDQSGVVPGATHNLNGCGDSITDDLIRRVERFAGSISGKT